MQPDRQVRHRRPDGRHRPDRPEDHRRHLRRRGPPRRRRLLGQGSDQGRPLGGLRRALRREERRRRRARRPLRAAGRVRDRRRAPGLDRGRLLRDRGEGIAATGSRSSSASTSTCARPRSSATSTCAGRSTRRRPPTATSAATTTTSRGSAPTRPRRCATPPARAAAIASPAAGYAGLTKRPDGGAFADRPLAAVHCTANCPAAGCGRGPRPSSRDEALVVEPVQELAVVLGEPDDRRALALRRGRRAASSSRFSACSKSVSTGQPCGQRSGLPSCSSIRSIMSSLNVSPSSSAWTCASAAV